VPFPGHRRIAIQQVFLQNYRAKLRVSDSHTPMAQNREPGQEEQKLAVALAEKCKELRLIG
jgi:hypothetical protein